MTGDLYHAIVVHVKLFIAHLFCTRINIECVHILAIQLIMSSLPYLDIPIFIAYYGSCDHYPCF